MRFFFRLFMWILPLPVFWLVWGVFGGDIPEVNSIRFMGWRIQDLPFTLSRLQTDIFILPILYIIYSATIDPLARREARLLNRAFEDVKNSIQSGLLFTGGMYTLIMVVVMLLSMIPVVGTQVLFTAVGMIAVLFLAWESIAEGSFSECLAAIGFRVFLPVSVVAGFLTGAAFAVVTFVGLLLIFFMQHTRRYPLF